MNDEDCAALNRFIGAELRKRRNARELTRDALVETLDFDLSAQSIANYEQGVRPMTVPRFVQVSYALHEWPPTILSRALQQAGDPRCDTCGRPR